MAGSEWVCLGRHHGGVRVSSLPCSARPVPSPSYERVAAAWPQRWTLPAPLNDYLTTVPKIRGRHVKSSKVVLLFSATMRCTSSAMTVSVDFPLLIIIPCAPSSADHSTPPLQAGNS